MVVFRLCVMVVLSAAVPVSRAAEPAPPFRAGPTWQESLLATRDALPAWAKRQGIELPERAPNQPPAYFTALWRQTQERFPRESAWIDRDIEELPRFFEWFLRPDKVEIERRLVFRAADDIARFGTPWANAKKDQWRREADSLTRGKVPSSDRRWLDLYACICTYRDVLDAVSAVNIAALRAAVDDDLAASFPDRYRADGFRRRLDALERRLAPVLISLEEGGEECHADDLQLLVDEFRLVQREALLANPLLDFDRLLLVRRKDPDKSRKYFTDLGLPSNWQGNCALRRDGWENEIALLTPVGPTGRLSTLYRPESDQCLADVDVHWDATRMLLSMQKPDHRRWQVWELDVNGRGLRQITPELAETDNYDACYLPNGDILFASTAVYQGVPCVSGGNRVANLFRIDADGKNLRQLCFDQDHNWCPTVMHDGRVLYTRWEYADTPHYFPRLLMRMNPDGTGQAEHYGSNSYWPNSLFFARPIPGHPTKLVAIYSGHHGNPRMGGLLILDPARGRHEAEGVVQTIPKGHGPFVPKIGDGIVDGLWPKFLHPFPLSEKYFLVSCKPAPQRPWGVYLVDVFDNMVLLCEQPAYALFEPIPLRPQPRPPIVPDRVDPKSKTATVYLADVYAGAGLQGVPRGTIKQLRLFEYHYTYPGTGGHIHIGVDGPWDVHRILGTTDVQEDGSAAFEIPANTPVAVQTLDEQGRAVQLMRSWLVGMPGEVVTCVGCHESQNTGPPPRGNMAMRRGAASLKPWYGPPRGFSFRREVQPVLDKYCVGCHDGRPPEGDATALDLRGDQSPVKACDNRFDAAYMALHPYVRRPGNESDYHLPKPYEYHASTSPLVQMLAKGHYGVRLDGEAWDRLTTWIDLNVPDHGTWGEHREIRKPFHPLRQQTRAAYANRTEDPEAILGDYQPGSVAFVAPTKALATAKPLTVKGWLFDAAEAKRRQDAVGLSAEMRVDLGEGKSLVLVLVPPGEFVMGDAQGAPDEQPAAVVKISRPFYLGKCEVSNAQYGVFDPTHRSGVISRFGKDHASRGEEAERPDQPVIRVSWQQAMAYCEWLSRKTGKRFTLPTEAQWEYACRAGTATPLNYGSLESDFGKFENLADASLVLTGGFGSFDWVLKRKDVQDGQRVTAPVGKYRPNAWGLCDMHGNVAEWTRSAYQPYPSRDDGRDAGNPQGLKVARGGSFYDLPRCARSAFRLHYSAHQAVFNVGFRVACAADAFAAPAAKE